MQHWDITNERIKMAPSANVNQKKTVWTPLLFSAGIHALLACLLFAQSSSVSPQKPIKAETKKTIQAYMFSAAKLKKMQKNHADTPIDRPTKAVQGPPPSFIKQATVANKINKRSRLKESLAALDVEIAAQQEKRRQREEQNAIPPPEMKIVALSSVTSPPAILTTEQEVKAVTVKRVPDTLQKRPMLPPKVTPPPPVEADSSPRAFSIDPLFAYQREVAMKIQGYMRMTNRMYGESCLLVLRLAQNGIVLEVKSNKQKTTLCHAAEKAVLLAGQMPVPNEQSLLNELRELTILIEPRR